VASSGSFIICCAVVSTEEMVSAIFSAISGISTTSSEISIIFHIPTVLS